MAHPATGSSMHAPPHRLVEGLVEDVVQIPGRDHDAEVPLGEVVQVLAEAVELPESRHHHVAAQHPYGTGGTKKRGRGQRAFGIEQSIAERSKQVTVFQRKTPQKSYKAKKF